MKNILMYKQLLLVGSVSLVLSACGGDEATNFTHEESGPELAAALHSERILLQDPGLSSVILGGPAGGAHCIDLNGVDKKFGELTRSDWDQWVPDYRYSLREEHLSVEPFDEASGVIRQRFQPTHNGSPRVLMASNLTEYQTYRVMTSIFLEPGWEWGGKVSQGGKLAFGLGGGTAPSGGTTDASGFTARLMWKGSYKDGTAKLGIYAYSADRPKRYGENHLFDIEARIGEWMDIIYEIDLNSSTKVSDGSMRAWVDGELVLNEQGVGWQLAGDTPVIDTLYYSSFYGGSTKEWSPSQTTYAKFRNICWAPVIDGYSGIDPDAGRILFPHGHQQLSKPGAATISLIAPTD